MAIVKKKMSFINKIDVYKAFTTKNNKAYIAQANFICMTASCGLMVYFYSKSVNLRELKEKYNNLSNKYASYFRWTSFCIATLGIYNYLLYNKYRLKNIETLFNIPKTFGITNKTRYRISGFIGFFALIIEFLGWKEIGLLPLIPNENIIRNNEKQLVNGIYKYIRHPIYVCEFSWMFNIAFILDDPMLMLFSIFMWTPAGYLLCKFDEKELLDIFGDEYKKYMINTGFIVPKLNKLVEFVGFVLSLGNKYN